MYYGMIIILSMLSLIIYKVLYFLFLLGYETLVLQKINQLLTQMEALKKDVATIKRNQSPSVVAFNDAASNDGETLPFQLPLKTEREVDDAERVVSQNQLMARRLVRTFVCKFNMTYLMLALASVVDSGAPLISDALCTDFGDWARAACRRLAVSCQLSTYMLVLTIE